MVTSENGNLNEGIYEVRKDYTISLPSFFQDQSNMPSKDGQWWDMYRGDTEYYSDWASHLPDVEWDFLRIEPGGIFTIKRGYRWDGASNPVSLMEHHNYRSSLVHDALYDLMRMKYLLPDTNHQGTCFDGHSQWGDGDYNRAMADIIHYMIARQDGDSKKGAQSDFRTIRKLGACKTHNSDMLFGGKYHVSELTAYSSNNRIKLEWRPQNFCQKDPHPYLVARYELIRNGEVYDTVNTFASFFPPTLNTSYEDLNVVNGEFYRYQFMPIAEGDDIISLILAARKCWSNTVYAVPNKGAGNALQLDGIDDNFASNTVCNDLCYNPNPSLFPLSFTVEAWVFPEEKSGINSIVSFNTIEGGNYNLFMYDGDNQKFCYYDDDNGFLLSNDLFPENKWYHVALVIDSLNQGSLYVNSVEQITFETDIRPSFGGRFSIGQEWDKESRSQFFKGVIDEVRIWNKARTKEDIDASMYHPLYGNEANLISLWHFDEPNEQIPDIGIINIPEKACDATANSNDEYLNGGQIDEITFIPSGAMQMPTSIEDNSTSEVFSKHLIRNYPNPFSSSTVIKYSKPNNVKIEITIFDMAGRTIKKFRENSVHSEHGEITWDGTNEKGSSVETGIYFCQLKAGNYMETIKMILLRLNLTFTMGSSSSQKL